MKKTKLTRSLMAAVSIVALSAVMYGCVHSGDDAEEPMVEAPDLGPAQTAASDAADAAKAASDAAAAAVAGAAGSSSADPASYVEARDAAAAAMAASDAAAAASADAAAATTLDDAEAAQAAAVAAQTAAEAAQADAEMYAQMVADAQAALDQAEADRIAAEEQAEADRIAAEEEAARQAEAEAAALAAARNAADMAADAAATSSYSAAAAVMAVEDDAGADQTSYDAAAAAAADAMAAATAAREASDAANRATTSADAEMYQMTAETQQGMAADSLSDAMMYAGMVTQAKADADEAARIAAAAAEAAQMLADTKAAAQAAEDAAATAKDAAAMSVTDVEDSGVLETDVTAAAAFARAEDARDDAAAAHLNAVDANLKAQAAMTQEDATMYKNMAEAAQMAAENAQMAAARFAGIVSETQTTADNKAQEEADQAEQDRLAAEAEEQRKMDVADAKSTAMQSYMDADADAMKAEAQADAAEATAPGTAGANAARAAATAARTAATAAKTAHDAIMDDMTKAEADMQSAEAATQAGNANMGYMTAKAQNDAVQTAALIGEQQQEARDLSDAQSDAKMYADAAKGHYESAMSKATDARAQANMARAAANRAMDARTDYENADKYADMAEANADAAEAARDAAKAANDAAQAAYMAAMNAEAVMDDPATEDVDESMKASQVARAEADKAKAQNEIATANHTGDDGAGMQYMAAKDNAMKAETAAGTHVLGLLKAANPADDPETKDVAATEDVVENDENANRVAAVAVALGEAAAAANQTSTDGTAATGITVTWNANVADDPETDADEAVTNVREFAITADGSAFAHADLSADPPTATSKPLMTLGDFAGVELTREPETGANVYAHIYTDITRQVAGKPERTVNFDRVVISGQPVGPLSRIELPDDATVTTTAGVSSFTASYDHDDDEVDPIATASFTCSSGDCSSTFDDNEVTQLGSGWRVSGVRDTGTRTVAAVDPVSDADYLTFGVWLSVLDLTGVNNADVEVGAFSSGSSTYSLVAGLTGTATYEGPAVGVKSMGGEVSHVDGTASLTANFGSIDTDAERNASPPADATPGSISGTVDIGGMMVHLGEDSDVSDGITGNTGAGAIVHQDAGTATYMYTGSWSGAFYGPATDGAETDPQPIAPGSIAGTFGVTGGEDDDAMSLVGAFGAHQSEDEMGQ